MKKYENGKVEIVKTQRVRLNGRLTNLYRAWEIKNNARIFAGEHSGKTYAEAYESYRRN